MNKVSGGLRRESGHSVREPTVNIQTGSLGSVEVSRGSESVGTSLLRLPDSPRLPDHRGDGCQLSGIAEVSVARGGIEWFRVVPSNPAGFQFDLRCSRWYQIVSCCPIWRHMVPNVTRSLGWSQVGLNLTLFNYLEVRTRVRNNHNT